jgi:small subunit ribosomal protein S2
LQLRNLKEERDANNFAKYLKKERNRKMKQIKKLELWLSGIEKLNKKPDLVFVLDPIRDQIAVKEACKCGIPIVAVADSNANPDLIDYPIPGNDDAVRAINLILSELHDAIERGQKRFSQAKEEEKPEQKKDK